MVVLKTNGGKDRLEVLGTLAHYFEDYKKILSNIMYKGGIRWIVNLSVVTHESIKLIEKKL